MSKPDDVIVIGGGIVGVSTALKLQSSGRRVRVLDRKGVAAEASRGNAGAFAFTDIVPLATPGIMRKAPKWLLDPNGPLSIPPAYALKIVPWMLRFWRASWRDRYAASCAAQIELMRLSQAALARQVADVSGEHLIQRDGQLQLYEGKKEFALSLPGWELRRRHGIDFKLLESPEAIAEIQPGLHGRFTHAGFTPTWINTTDPRSWTEHLASNFCERGGLVERQEVRAIRQRSGAVELVTGDGTLAANEVIVAAGAWSHRLARTVGDAIPLETERGYNTTLPPGAFELRTHLTFGGHGFVATKIAGGVRVGGGVELGGLALAPKYERADVMLRKAADFMPGLKTEGGTRWMGFRPSIPDSLPVVGRSRRAPKVIYAFGHGHLGLTQSAGTAEIVARLLAGDPPAIPLAPYSAYRF